MWTCDNVLHEAPVTGVRPDEVALNCPKQKLAKDTHKRNVKNAYKEP